MSNSVQPHGLQHNRLSCPLLSSGVCSNSRRVGDAIQPSHPLLPLLLLPSVFPSIRVFSHESALQVRWPNYWSFSISPTNGYSGLISFRIDWVDLLAVQGTLKSLLQHHSSKASILLVLNILFGPTLTTVHDYWKNLCFDYTAIYTPILQSRKLRLREV